MKRWWPWLLVLPTLAVSVAGWFLLPDELVVQIGLDGAAQQRSSQASRPADSPGAGGAGSVSGLLWGAPPEFGVDSVGRRLWRSGDYPSVEPMKRDLTVGVRFAECRKHKIFPGAVASLRITQWSIERR